jgi:hypothetical protein
MKTTRITGVKINKKKENKVLVAHFRNDKW